MFITTPNATLKIKFSTLFFCLFTMACSSLMAQCTNTMPLTADDATGIAQKIWEQMGYTYDGFKVVFVTKDHNKATYLQRDKQIRIRQGIVDTICTLGDYADDALAIIIAHELWHKKQGQDQTDASNIANAKIEQDADHFGLLAAHFSEYAALEIFDKLQEIINVSDKSRKKRNDEVAQKLKSQLEEYNLAIYYTLIGEKATLARAKDILAHINASLKKNNDMVFKQLLYQEGVVAFLQALNVTSYKDKYQFPIDIISDAFLNPKTRGGIGGTNLTLFNEYIEEAKALFNQADMDKDDYFEAKMGLACATFLADKVNGTNDAHGMIQGWLTAHPETTEATSDWQKEQNRNRSEQRKKMKKLQSLQPSDNYKGVEDTLVLSIEAVDDIDNALDAYRLTQDTDPLSSKELKNSILYVDRYEQTYYCFQECRKSNLVGTDVRNMENAIKIGNYCYFNASKTITLNYDVILQLDPKNNKTIRKVIKVFKTQI
jgi:hypothetical protein